MSPRARIVDPLILDALTAALLLTAIELQVWLSSSERHPWPAALGGVALSVAVALRRRFSLEALLAGAGALVVADVFGARLGQQALGSVLAGVLVFSGAGRWEPKRRALVGLAGGLVLMAIDPLLTGEAISGLLFVGLLVATAPWGVGVTLRERAERERAHRDRAERLDAEREQRAVAAVQRERTRIARELHDVIAHSVSVMVIQAAGARTVMDDDPDRAGAALRSVEQAGREALAELRRLLGVLDRSGDPRALAPQPGLAALAELLARCEAAGLLAELSIEGEPVALTAVLDLCAYRVVQEAITNTIKHAAGAQRIQVSLRWSRAELEIEVVDDGAGTASDDEEGGHGLAGMRERVALHDGSVETGVGAHGGFLVRARLPLALELVA
jgi:signal transduction histidine kinase